MLRSVIMALVLGTASTVAAQENTSELVDFMIRPSQDAVTPALDAAELDDPWAPLDAETPDPAPAPAEPAAADPAPRLPGRRPAAGTPEETPDPFEAVGVRFGTFIIRPSIEFGVAATDNANGGPDKDHAIGAIVAPAVSIRSDWNRHALEADAALDVLHYGDREIDVRQGSARVAGRLDINRNTAVDAQAAYFHTQDTYTDPDTPFGAVQRPANDRYSAEAGITHRFNRLAVRVGAQTERETHEAVALAGGGSDPREDLDYWRTGVRLRAALEAGPRLTPYVEAAAGRKEFDEEIDSSGFRRSGPWGELRGGLLFDLGPKTEGEVSIGYYREDPEDAGLEELSGWVADATLLWSPRRLTTVRFELTTDVSPTSIFGVSGSFVYSGRVSVEREIGQRLRVEAGLALQHERFVGGDIRETTKSAFAGLSYALSRSASLQARFEHERTDSSLPNSDGTVNTVSVRVRLQR